MFEAPDETVAAKVIVLPRSFGHAQTETWAALPWERFEKLIPACQAPVGTPSWASGSSTRSELGVEPERLTTTA